MGGSGAVEYADAFFSFTITFRTPLLQLPLYLQYQFFLYETISKLQDKGLSYNKITEWINRKWFYFFTTGVISEWPNVRTGSKSLSIDLNLLINKNNIY